MDGRRRLYDFEQTVWRTNGSQRCWAAPPPSARPDAVRRRAALPFGAFLTTRAAGGARPEASCDHAPASPPNSPIICRSEPERSRRSEPSTGRPEALHSREH